MHNGGEKERDNQGNEVCVSLCVCVGGSKERGISCKLWKFSLVNVKTTNLAKRVRAVMRMAEKAFKLFC